MDKIRSITVSDAEWRIMNALLKDESLRILNPPAICAISEIAIKSLPIQEEQTDPPKFWVTQAVVEAMYREYRTNDNDGRNLFLAMLRAALEEAGYNVILDSKVRT